jgi:hypothetical protein
MIDSISKKFVQYFFLNNSLYKYRRCACGNEKNNTLIGELCEATGIWLAPSRDGKWEFQCVEDFARPYDFGGLPLNTRVINMLNNRFNDNTIPVFTENYRNKTNEFIIDGAVSITEENVFFTDIIIYFHYDYTTRNFEKTAQWTYNRELATEPSIWFPNTKKIVYFSSILAETYRLYKEQRTLEVNAKWIYDISTPGGALGNIPALTHLGKLLIWYYARKPIWIEFSSNLKASILEPGDICKIDCKELRNTPYEYQEIIDDPKEGHYWQIYDITMSPQGTKIKARFVKPYVSIIDEQGNVVRLNPDEARGVRTLNNKPRPSNIL